MLSSRVGGELQRRDLPETATSMIASYSHLDWLRHSACWEVRGYLTDPSNGLPVDRPAVFADPAELKPALTEANYSESAAGSITADTFALLSRST